jgi:hypothetical protein
MLYLSGLDPSKFWSDAIEARVEMQNIMASASDPTCAIEKATGVKPNIGGLRIFGCEALSYVEKDKRHKFDPKFERCINLGPSPAHSHLTYKLLNLRTQQELFRRHVVFNERSFPLRPDTRISRPLVPPDLPDSSDASVAFSLLGKKFRLDGKKKEQMCKVMSISKYGNTVGMDYQTDSGEEYISTVPEVQSWIKTTDLQALHANVSTATFNKDREINMLA